MILIIVIGFLLLVGCTAIEKKKQTPPSVSTGQVIQSLNDTKTELEQAGQANTKVAANIDKALTLAQRLDALLEKIEQEQNASSDKNIVKTIK